MLNHGWGCEQQATEEALEEREARRAEAAAALERRMAAMEAAMAARRTPIAEAKPEAARGPGADLRFQVHFTAFPCMHCKWSRICIALLAAGSKSMYHGLQMSSLECVHCGHACSERSMVAVQDVHVSYEISPAYRLGLN